MLTVKDLRDHGYKVRVRHHRCYEAPNLFGKARLSSKGGLTEVVVTAPPEFNEEYTGVADFNGNRQYNRKLGVRIALGRICKKMGLKTK